MNSTQRFLYTQATRPLISGPVEKSKKRSSIIDYKNVFLRPTFKESIVCEAYDMKIPAYSVEVDSDSFWKFLYSNKWKDCCMIRVKPGFLNTDLTMTLATLLENKQISSHKTVGFIKFRSSNINEVKPQKYGTIRLEFTYFGRNTEYIGRSKSEVFRKERKVNKTTSLKSRLERSILRHEDKQKTLGYKVRVSKLFLSDKLLTKTRNMLEKTVLDAELGQIKKSAEPPTETKNAETEGSTISYSKWKKFSEKAFGIIGSQEVFRALLNSHPDCPKMIFKRSLARLKGYGRLDRIFKKKVRSKHKNKKQTVDTDSKIKEEKEETEEIFEIYKTSNMLSPEHNIKEIQIIQEKLLECLGHFVVRQEILCFSNGFSTIRTLVFIKPSLFMEVYF
ncbi:Hypothetical predicted protein [Octopus vulgaris]|uniref:Uncharacterized protein n=1 Tax=Octopus vulgaris TaxID=6645 RepID=A0AA36F799_OCTVU|nr:Hypothetical predicted protein [Octopus vulgaris]